jgi:hypothetical protein
MAQLKPEHFKALELFEEGTLSIKEIALSCNIPLDTMYDLIEGDMSNLGEIATLFKAEVDKITIRSGQKIRALVKDNKKLALLEMNDYLRHLRSKKKKSKGWKLEVDRVVRLITSLSKTTPAVEIGTFSYTQGLNAEDLIHEFNRLHSLARHALDGKGVLGLEQGGTRELPEVAPERDNVQEEP